MREWPEYIMERPNSMNQWNREVTSYIPKFFNKIVEKLDNKTINNSKNSLASLMNQIKEEEKTEEHTIAEQNTTIQSKKEIIDEKKTIE